jgi:hypothetical protein
MKLYSPVEEQANLEEKQGEQPAPYNWLAVLVIFLGYILCALVL